MVKTDGVSFMHERGIPVIDDSCPGHLERDPDQGIRIGNVIGLEGRGDDQTR